MQQKPRILFADDDSDTCEMVELILRYAGFSVSVADDPTEILPLFSTHHFDALVLDNWMPGITGIEICRQIRTLDRNIPIFFCSGAVTSTDLDEAAKAGAQGYLEKPYDPDELIQLLRTSVRNV